MTFSIVDAIGNTPLVEIQKTNPVPGVRIFAKLEYMNPGGSIKDRAALYMINQAEASGALTPDKTVIEATSGNTGIGLAMICAVKGYSLALTMAENASEERKSILRARGAKIILTPKHLGSDGAIEEAYRLARENPDQYFITDQYNNEANWKSHYHSTGPEIMEQTGGDVNSVVATVGTSGTLMGLARYFRDTAPQVNVVCAEPYLGHRIQGLKNMKESYTPGIFDKQILEHNVRVEDDAAFDMARRLAREEGLFVGMSSGAAMTAAIQEARRIENGVIVVIFPDSGERYLSTSLYKVDTAMDLSLFNTRSMEKSAFVPMKADKISIYTCGPTADRRLHVGRFRRYIFTDLLIRYFEHHQLGVNHVVNVTDYDDKTIQGSENEGKTLEAFTGPHLEAFRSDLSRLGVRPAQAYPKVSDHFADMVDLTRKLMDNGHAYEKLHSVYMDINKVPGYGQLSRVDLNKIRLGATVDLDEYEKQNPRDFTLLKRVTLAELRRGIGLKTQWGNVRPSLHLQCAAISMKYLGDRFDIHTGDRELTFPHHENEMAIATALADSPLANVWLHCDRVHYDGSLGVESIEALTLDALAAQGWDMETLRFWLMSVHHRKPLTLSDQTLKNARYTLERINRCIETLGSVNGNESRGDIDQLIYDLRQGVLAPLGDDLKTAPVISSLVSNVKKINAMMSRHCISKHDAARLIACFKEVNTILQVFEFDRKQEYPARVKELMAARDRARKQKDWATADEIRDEIRNLGVVLHDKKVEP